MPIQLPPVPQSKDFKDPVWARWLDLLRSNIATSVTSLVISTANGFGGTVTSAGGVSTVTLRVTVTGILKGNGAGAIVPAVAGTDYVQSVAVTAPVTNSGSAANPNIGMPKSTAAVDGYLAATDFASFAGKVATVSVTAPITNTGTATNPVIALASGVVTPGTYGTAVQIPIVTVDTFGRVTGISTSGTVVQAVRSGTTGSRPVGAVDGTMYLDTTIGQPIWALSGAWINAAGVNV